MRVISIAKEFTLMMIIVWSTFIGVGIVSIFDYTNTPKLVLDIIILIIDIVLLINSIRKYNYVNTIDKIVKKGLL